MYYNSDNNREDKKTAKTNVNKAVLVENPSTHMESSSKGTSVKTPRSAAPLKTPCRGRAGWGQSSVINTQAGTACWNMSLPGIPLFDWNPDPGSASSLFAKACDSRSWAQVREEGAVVTSASRVESVLLRLGRSWKCWSHRTQPVEASEDALIRVKDLFAEERNVVD